MTGFQQVIGVDFSGGERAARHIWLARVEAVSAAQRARTAGSAALRLTELSCLGDLVGDVDRAAAMAALSGLILRSDRSLWGMDFPFGLPVELEAMGEGWDEQLAFLSEWKGDARDFGVWCVGQAKARGREMHIRRITDRETRTPFDCYHYRIVYQTFHGMRDVLRVLRTDPATAVLPFQYARLPSAGRVVVEACPSSTLKRWGLPHRNYKEPAAKRVSAPKARTRRAILAGLEPLIEIQPGDRKRLLANPGGDALDAVIAAVGAAQRFAEVDHSAIRRHPRYGREGYVFA